MLSRDYQPLPPDESEAGDDRLDHLVNGGDDSRGGSEGVLVFDQIGHLFIERNAFHPFAGVRYLPFHRLRIDMHL